MTSADSTIPAAPRLPSNIGSIQVDPAVGDDSPTTLDTLQETSEAQWDQVKAAFNTCVETSKATLAALEALTKLVDSRFDALDRSREAESKMLVARFGDVDEQLAKARSGITRANTLIASMNQIVTGVRSHGRSLQDMRDKDHARIIEIGDEVQAIRMSMPDEPPPGLHVVSRQG